MEKGNLSRKSAEKWLQSALHYVPADLFRKAKGSHLSRFS